MTGDNPLAGLMTLGGDRVGVVHALAEASAAIARLDQALTSHPLRQAVLHRSRLEAVRRQAAVDGQLIDPWHLAATLEGLRLRMDPYLRIIDRGQIIDAARAALELHQWIVEPDFDQEGEVQRAEAILADQPATLPPLLAAAQGFRVWIDSGGMRAPLRSAVIRYWRKRNLLRMPMPLTGAAALRAEQSWEPGDWTPAFLKALATEAADGLDLLYTLERAWFEARHGIAGRRKHSRAGMAIDVLAAVPVLSATSLAGILGIAVKNALRILDELVAAEIAIEVTHRSKRRLFGLKGLAPLRDVIRPPYRPDPERGRGRPRLETEDDLSEPVPLLPLPPLTPIERRSFDYTALEEAMAHLDAVVRRTRHVLTRRGPDLLSASETRPIESQADILGEEDDTIMTQQAISR
ncbi:hypothetical protein ACELLULO517_22105 [Acidisoma cellulosilytica]|uniref:Uncharacterized protein n=1 Tax=Acidisoma cellulosilyticum TaxID=2802395 RepID=A0A963Z6V5_9PROT|nr:hypothetical protein [Acidisoma cellulosilyticum]MCB8882957.1 hypothetical protein [Acidisoma cellulosilyticum]